MLKQRAFVLMMSRYSFPRESQEEFAVVSMFRRLLGPPLRLGDVVRSPHIASRQSTKGLDLPLCPLPPFCHLTEVSLPKKRSPNAFYVGRRTRI